MAEIYPLLIRVAGMGKLLFDNLLNITLKKDMRYLSIDFGTVLTKAAVYETTTNKLVLVQMNEDDGDDVGVRAHNISYEMPTAVFFDNNSQKYKIGQEAVNNRGTDPDNFHSLFKPKLSEAQSEYYLKFVEEILRYVIVKAQKTIKPNNTRRIMPIIFKISNSIDNTKAILSSFPIFYEIRYIKMSCIIIAIH